MRWIHNHPVFVGTLALCVLIILAGLWLVWERRQTARAAQSRLVSAEAALRRLRGTVPALTSETPQDLETELGAVAGNRDALRARLISNADETGIVPKRVEPAGASDAYFEMASFVERMRHHAHRRGVETKPDERFSFAEYAHNGPVREDIPFVFRECRALEVLLVTLFDAQPQQLISVQRERRSTGNRNPAGAGLINPANAQADFFDWDLRLSVRRPASVTAGGIRISFVGQTRSLRILLNALANSTQPLIVRAVEVGGPSASTKPAKTAEPESARAEPLVSGALSRFTVTVEMIDQTAALPGV